MTVDLPSPRVGPALEHAPQPIKVVLNWGRRYSLWVFNFGLACCAIEFIAASMARHDFIRLGVIPFAPGPRQADLMVVSGTVTDKMAPAVRRLYDQMPEPKYVISFGACSNSGGPYWDSYCVTKGVDTIIPVDVYVPGCPPRPEALLQGIIALQAKIAGESVSGKGIQRRYAGGRLASAAEVQRPLLTPDGSHGSHESRDSHESRVSHESRGSRGSHGSHVANESRGSRSAASVPEAIPGRGDPLVRRPGDPAPPDPTTAVLEPVDPDGFTAGEPGSPPTQAIPVGEQRAPGPDSRGQRRGRRGVPPRRRGNLADDLFDLGDEDDR